MAAADGFRLSVSKDKLEDAQKPVSAVIPVKSLSDFATIAGKDKDDADVVLAIHENASRAILHLSDTDFDSGLIAGNFPDYNQIVPKRWSTRVTVDTGEFLRACKTALVFARYEAYIVKLGVQERVMTVSAASVEVGSNVTEIDVEVEGELLDISFNARFLVDALSVIDGEKVVVELESPAYPGVFKAAGDDGFIHVIIPMHTL